MEFSLGKLRLQHFCHRHNCGFLPNRMTERSVELALADWWLLQREEQAVCEVGAVTPYYWPKRVRRIVDPKDRNLLVTDRDSYMNIDLSESEILSISTFEHIGMGEYGEPRSPHLVIDALQKLFRESPQFLITVPLGYNASLDSFAHRVRGVPSDVQRLFLVRSSTGNDWRETKQPSPKQCHYGEWANCVMFLLRGSQDAIT